MLKFFSGTESDVFLVSYTRQRKTQKTYTDEDLQTKRERLFYIVCVSSFSKEMIDCLENSF